MYKKSVSGKLFVGIDKVIESLILKRQRAQNNLLKAAVWSKMLADLQYANSKFPEKL